ncbi:MAG: hypothetical protein MN733_21150 [Nitrososphaera sp.]|nr:hypothetical protein [Nitrososphaera sp.]
MILEAHYASEAVALHRLPETRVVIPFSVEDLWAVARNLALGILLVAATFLMPASVIARDDPPIPPDPPPSSCSNTIDDYIDPTYGQQIRQLWKPDGHEHNMYYFRNPWNADNSYMIGIESDLKEENWQVVLYDGAGCFIKELFPITKYDWRLVWDRNNPNILYTWTSSKLYRYDVTTATAQLLKSFAPLTLKPAGPSLNQAGDRILVITSDDTFRSYRLPDMQQERMFKAAYPPNCSTNWRNERYIGYQNYIATACPSGGSSTLLIYNDTEVLLHRFDGIPLGHHDFSPDGQLAYHRWNGVAKQTEIRMVNLDGTSDQILHSISQDQSQHIQNLHVSWPDRVDDWFIVSFYPPSANLPSTYGPPLDDILLIRTNGTVQYLARTGAMYGPKQLFWSLPLASPSSDGTRISFNSGCSNDIPTLGCTPSGTIDHYILFDN